MICKFLKILVLKPKHLTQLLSCATCSVSRCDLDLLVSPQNFLFANIFLFHAFAYPMDLPLPQISFIPSFSSPSSFCSLHISCCITLVRASHTAHNTSLSNTTTHPACVSGRRWIMPSLIRISGMDILRAVQVFMRQGTDKLECLGLSRSVWQTGGWIRDGKPRAQVRKGFQGCFDSQKRLLKS